MDVHLFTVKNSNLLVVLMAVLVVAGEMLEVDDRLDDEAAAARLKAELDRIYARALEVTAHPARQ